jgi:hypothetical protein
MTWYIGKELLSCSLALSFQTSIDDDARLDKVGSDSAVLSHYSARPMDLALSPCSQWKPPPPRSQSPVAPNLALSASLAAGEHPAYPVPSAHQSSSPRAHIQILYRWCVSCSSPLPPFLSPAVIFLLPPRSAHRAISLLPNEHNVGDLPHGNLGSSMRIKIPSGDLLPWIFLALSPKKA